MRTPFKIIVAALAATTALTAPPADARPNERGKAADQLNDPYNQVKAAAAVAILSQMILDMRVGPLARAMGDLGDEDARRVPYDARLGDVAGPEARAVPERMAREVPRAMATAGDMAAAIDAMIPQITAMSDQMRREMERATRRY